MSRIATPDESAKLKRGRPTKYPWTRWTNGRTWVAVKGEDYTIDTYVFQIGLHLHARNHGMTVSTITDGDTIIFRFRSAA